MPTSSEADPLLSLRRSGMTLKQIGAVMGINHRTVGRRLAKHCGITNPPGAPRARVDVSDLVDSIRDGMTLTAFGEAQGVSQTTVTRRLREMGIHKSTELRFNHSFFRSLETEAQAYWFGFLMADGCVVVRKGHNQARKTVKLGLALGDLEHVQKFNAALGSIEKIRIYRSTGFGTTNGQGIAEVKFESKQMADDLIALGCVPRKSLILRFPSVPDHLVSHFVRGYFDGDGSISYRDFCGTMVSAQLRLRFCGTESFLATLKSNLGVDPGLRLHKQNSIFQLDICGNKQCRRIGAWMYANATIWLDRKRSIYEGTAEQDRQRRAEVNATREERKRALSSTINR